LINKVYYSPVLLGVTPKILNLLEKEMICVTSALMLVFDTSHDELTEAMPVFFVVMCYVY